jgi:hypothetical protein
MLKNEIIRLFRLYNILNIDQIAAHFGLSGSNKVKQIVSELYEEQIIRKRIIFQLPNNVPNMEYYTYN